jgi:heat shock protein HslJ
MIKTYVVSFAFLLIMLTACNAAPASNDSLDGTSWELYAISKHFLIEGSTITIAFEDGQVSGSAGCNSYSGEYQVNGKKIKFGMLASTLMACIDTAIMEQETMFMQMLGDAHRFEIVDGQLQIYWSDHEALTFIPVQ